MHLPEASFWIGLTVFGTGLSFIINSIKGKSYGVILWLAVALAVLGVGAMGYGIYGVYYTAPVRLPGWVSLLVLTWALLALDVYHRRKNRRVMATDLAPVHDISEKSKVLAALPVYPQDLHLELLHFCRGVSFDFHITALFLNLSIVSDVDTGFKNLELTCKITDRVHRLKPMDDLCLSAWIVRTKVNHPNYPYKTFDDSSLEDLSLWKDLRKNGLKSGLEKNGWVGFSVENESAVNVPGNFSVIVNVPNQ